MLKKDNVCARSDEKYTKTTLVYADSSKVLFYDAAAKTELLLLILVLTTIRYPTPQLVFS